jgi:hypothetical protein
MNKDNINTHNSYSVSKTVSHFIHERYGASSVMSACAGTDLYENTCSVNPVPGLRSHVGKSGKDLLHSVVVVRSLAGVSDRRLFVQVFALIFAIVVWQVV